MNASKMTITLFNGVSFLLTTAGLAALFESQAGPMFGERAGLVIAVLAAALLSAGTQLAIRAHWERLGVEGVKVSITTLTVAIIASAISWFGSAGGFALLFSSGDMLASKQQRQGAVISAPLNDFANQFANLRAEIGTLSARATALSEDEVAGRVTCSNDKANKKKCGPKCRLRQRHAATLVASEERAAELQAASQTIAIDLSMTSDIATQQEKYADAVRLQGNADQPKIAITLRSMASELTDGAIDPSSGKKLICEDPSFADALESLATRVEQRVELPLAAPQAQTISLVDAGTCVARRVGELLKVTPACDPPMSDAPLLSALALEVILVLLILGDVSRRKRLGQLPTGAEEYQQAAQKRTDADLLRCAWLLESFSLYSWDAGLSGRRLAVPLNGSVDALATGMRLVRYFDDIETDLVRFPIGDIDPEWVSQRVEAFGPATEFNLYTWPDEADEELRRAERDIAAAGASA